MSQEGELQGLGVTAVDADAIEAQVLAKVRECRHSPRSLVHLLHVALSGKQGRGTGSTA